MHTDTTGEVINKEGFISALKNLQMGGRETTSHEQAILEEYGSRVAEDMGHGDFEKIGRALVDLIGTLPGSNLSLEAKGKKHTVRTLVASHIAVDADLEEKNGVALVGYVADINTEQVKLRLTRKGNESNRCVLNLEITAHGELKGGSLNFNGLSDKSSSINFEGDGLISKTSGDLEKLVDTKIALSNVINSITSGQSLGEKDDILNIYKSTFAQAN
ncbi:MAG: hypothetical protein AAB778_03150 [Patescibacteria group bacterium]